MTVQALQAVVALREPDGPIPALSVPERAFDKVLASEFRFAASAIAMVNTDPHLEADMGIPQWLQPMALRPLFKPNHSTNHAWECYEQQFAAQNSTRCQVSMADMVLNPIGTILIKVVHPNFSSYVSRLADLGGLIVLVNLAFEMKREMRTGALVADARGEFVAAHAVQCRHPHREDDPLWMPLAKCCLSRQYYRTRRGLR
jgi:hypothetical protein